VKLKVISGGQTGADLAGLWAATVFGIPTGGTAPRGYRTLLGLKPWLETGFGLKQSQDTNYKTRTLKNIQDSHYTLLFTKDHNSAGSKLTHAYCIKNWKQCFRFMFTNGEKLDLVDTYSQSIIAMEQQSAYNERLGLDEVVINIAGNATENWNRAFEVTFLTLCEIFKDLGFEQVVNHGSLSLLSKSLKDKFEP
jgi:hypothetical protein